ncbi:MAG TPA: hypothetical protein VIW64_11900 [Pyrinomonadaceae bacterium]
MRTATWFLVLAVIVSSYGCGRINARSKSTASPANSVVVSGLTSPKAETRIDFATQIQPIFEARCQPCHFSGGKVYGRMPFDRPETIKTLNTKLFTRIKDEKERQLIRDFLAQE